MIRDRRWLWLLAALPPLLYLPLHAQEKPAAETAEPPRQAAAAPDATPDATPAAEAAPAAAPDPTDERVSADNNLSFPVDI